MDPFPTLYEAFLRAAEVDSGLRKETFLEQASRHIAEGALRASGCSFSETWGRRGLLILGADFDRTEIIPRENKTESPNRAEIPPLAMADHRLIFIDGPEVDCQVVRETGEHGDRDGWKDVRVAAGDAERLWLRNAPNPKEAAPSRASYEAGDRAKILLAKCFPIIPSKADVSNADLVRRVQAKHCEEGLKGGPPSLTIKKKIRPNSSEAVS